MEAKISHQLQQPRRRRLLLPQNLTMLLRSSSSPILNSWIPADHSAGDHPLLKSRSLSTSSSSRPMSRTLSDGDLTSLSSAAAPAPKRRSHGGGGLPPPIPSSEHHHHHKSESKQSLVRLLSNSGLDGFCAVETERNASPLVGCGGSGGGGGDGRICTGGGGGGGDCGPNTDAYYLNMIELNPGNSLVLANYAKFLKDVRGDLERAQEYCERAILVSPGDADVLSMYAGLVWDTSKDAERAESYFGRAVQADPSDCYVMASYAQFLWDADDEEEDEVARENNFTQSPFLCGSTTQSVAAAS